MPDPQNFQNDNASYDEDELDFTSEELDTQVQRAQDQISELRRRQEQIEKEKQHLEELSRKQDQLEKGRTELIEKLQRAINQLRREEVESQKRLEELEVIDEAFVRHLKELQSISPKAWMSSELQKELTKSLACLEEAQTDFTKLSPKISLELMESTLSSGGDYEEASGGEVRNFIYWLVAGFAFTLPILILGVIALVVVALKLTPIH